MVLTHDPTGRLRDRAYFSTDTERSVEDTLPIGFLAYALLLLWYFQHGNPTKDVARARREAPWYAQKAEPSFADMLVAIRRSIWKQRLTAHPSRGHPPEKSELLLPSWALAA